MSQNRPHKQGGRPRALSASKCARAKELFVQGCSIGQITQRLDISRATLYRYKAQWKVPDLKIGVLDFFKRSLSYYQRFPEGDRVGFFDIQVAKLLAEKLERRVRFVPVSFPRLFDGVHSGEFEIGMGLVGRSEARLRDFALSEPYANVLGCPTGAMVARKPLQISSSEPASWAGLRVSVMERSLSHEWLLRSQAPVASILTHSYPTEFKSALRCNRIDAVVDAWPIANEFVESDPEYEIKGPIIDFGYAPTCLVLGKGDETMSDRLSEAILELRRAYRIEPLEERMLRVLANGRER